MSDLINLIRTHWHARPPASAADIAQLEQRLAVKFPKDYIDLQAWSNGGEAKLGTAYFTIWPVQDVARRNISASITHYMSARFIGIGTNGGGELYALDYSASAEPTLAIVPLGALDPESKFIIGASLTEGIRMALDGTFDDGDYSVATPSAPSADIQKIYNSNLRYAAELRWQAKEYGNFISLLDRIDGPLTALELKKLSFAKSRKRD